MQLSSFLCTDVYARPQNTTCQVCARSQQYESSVRYSANKEEHEHGHKCSTPYETS